MADLLIVELYDCRNPAARDRGIAAAISAVRRGDLIVLPTDTVYGVGGDAFKPTVVTAIQLAKGRGRETAPPVLIGSRRTLDGLVQRLSPYARELAEAFWPGGLTLLIAHAPSLEWELGDADGTVAVRMPLHPVALEVLRETGPMAVASANQHGRPPATTAAEAKEQLGYSPRVYLDGGTCAAPVPSTIVDVTGQVPEVVRVGAVSMDKLREVVPNLIEPQDEPVEAVSPPPSVVAAVSEQGE